MPDALNLPPDAPRTRRAHPVDGAGRPAPAGGWLLFVVFVAGAALMAFEIVGSRLLAPTFGSSTYVWGSLISVFLAALASGYSLGGRLADRRPNAATLATLLTCAAILVAATVLLSEPLQDWITDVNPRGTRSNPLIASVLLFGPASVLIGMVSPFAVRLRALDVATLGRTAGSLYGLSTAGSIAGTIAASFWLVQQAGSDATVLIVAGAIAACAVMAAVGGHARARAVGFTLFGVLAVLVVWGLGAGGADIGSKFSGASSDYSPVFHAGGYRPEFQPDQSGTLRAQQDSGYHRIRVVDYAAGQFGARPVRVMHFDNSSQAAVPLVKGKPVTAGVPRFGYLRVIDLLPAIRPEAQRVLLVGLGSGAAAMRLAELRPDLDIDVVEIDPAVVAVARKWFGYRDSSNGNPRITTHVGDGRTWLAAQPDSAEFDAVYIDAYFADSIPFHLTTREFLELVRSHLAPDGIASANLIGAVEGSRSELFRSMHRTWSKVFSDVATYPVPAEGGSLDLSTFTNIELIASADRGVLPPRGGEASLVEAADLDVPASTLLDASFTRLIAARYSRSISTSGVPVLTDDRAPVDSLLAVDGI